MPTYRPDVSREVDLIEEVARLHGYDRIPEPAQVPIPSRPAQEDAADRLRTKTRELMRGLGYRETYTNSMLRTEQAERFNVPALVPSANGDTPPVVETLNPISRTMAALRPALLPGLLAVMQHNQNHGQDALRFFEFGHVYHHAGDNADPVVPGFAEHEALIITLSGPHAPTGWDTDARAADFYDLKGTVETVLDALGIRDAAFAPADATDAVITYHLDVILDGQTVGAIARVDDRVTTDFDVEAPAFVAELNWTALAQHAERHEERDYAPIARFPVVERDLAIVVDADQPVGPLMDLIRTEGAPLLQAVGLFDIYEGEGIPAGHKSLAFALRFGADRTLTDDEVDAQVEAIVGALDAQYDAQLRA